MAGTIWGPRWYGKSAWAVPDDLWATLVAAQRLLHLDLAGLYTPPTNLISLPGTAVILVPVAAVTEAAGLPLLHAGSQGAHPVVWLLAGPCETALAAVALFAADAAAERLGASRPKRFLLAAAGATALWSVAVRWGHPEDAVATGLLLYAVLAAAGTRAGRAGWLAGAAVAGPAGQGGRAERAAARRGRRGQLDRHHQRGGQPAQRAHGRPPDAVDLPRPAPGGRVGCGRARQGGGDRGGLRVRARRPAAVAAAAMGHRRAGGPAVVDRGGARAALGVRAGDGGLLPVAAAGGGAGRGLGGLAPPHPGVRHRGRAHVLLPGAVAQPLGLVDADDRPARPHPVPRAPPAGRRRRGTHGA